MKKLIPLILVAVTIMACNIIPAPTAEPPVTEPPITEPPATEPPVVEPPVVTEPPIVNNVFCHELSLFLDPTLATGYDCQIVPESPYEMDLYPEHTELTLTGYPLVDKFFEPKIMVYPLAAYTLLAPSSIPGRVTALQALVTSGTVPPFASSFSESVPFLPLFNAAQAFYAQAQVQPFGSGSGVRFLTEFAQYYVPVNNTDLFYTFQGLTSDGQYWVTAILPINLAMLPASADPLPGGMSFEDFANNYSTYINDMVNQLNAQAPGNYTPTLTALDALVSSITITP